MSEIKVFRDVRFKGDWELNLIGRKYNIRIGRSQVAFWINGEPVLMRLSRRANASFSRWTAFGRAWGGEARN